MKYVSSFILSIGLLLAHTALADWNDEVMSIDAVKHWRMDDRIVHIRGKIVETFGSEGLRVVDDTGEIRVHFTNRELRDFRFDTGMRVEIKGLVIREDHHHYRDHHYDIEATSIRLHDGIIILDSAVEDAKAMQVSDHGAPAPSVIFPLRGR